MLIEYGNLAESLEISTQIFVQLWIFERRICAVVKQVFVLCVGCVVCLSIDYEIMDLLWYKLRLRKISIHNSFNWEAERSISWTGSVKRWQDDLFLSLISYCKEWLISTLQADQEQGPKRKISENLSLIKHFHCQAINNDDHCDDWWHFHTRN